MRIRSAVKVLPGRLGCVLEMVQPRDQRPVEHSLHACYVGLDGSAGEGFGGLYVDACRCGGEHPFVHAGDAIASAAPQDPGLVCTAYTVEVTVKPKLVQVNDPPGAKAPFSWAAVISDCQAGQALTSWCRAQTRPTGALMSIP